MARTIWQMKGKATQAGTFSWPKGTAKVVAEEVVAEHCSMRSAAAAAAAAAMAGAMHVAAAAVAVVVAAGL